MTQAMLDVQGVIKQILHMKIRLGYGESHEVVLYTFHKVHQVGLFCERAQMDAWENILSGRFNPEEKNGALSTLVT